MHYERLRDVPKCTFEGCDNREAACGLCAKHRYRLRKYASPDRLKSTPWGAPGQFLREVVLTYEGDECRPWPFARSSKGRGRIFVAGEKKWRRELAVPTLVCSQTNGPPPTKRHRATFSCDGAAEGCCTKRHISWQTQ